MSALKIATDPGTPAAPVLAVTQSVIHFIGPLTVWALFWESLHREPESQLDASVPPEGWQLELWAQRSESQTSPFRRTPRMLSLPAPQVIP